MDRRVALCLVILLLRHGPPSGWTRMTGAHKGISHVRRRILHYDGTHPQSWDLYDYTTNRLRPIGGEAILGRELIVFRPPVHPTMTHVASDTRRRGPFLFGEMHYQYSLSRPSMRRILRPCPIYLCSSTFDPTAEFCSTGGWGWGRFFFLAPPSPVCLFLFVMSNLYPYNYPHIPPYPVNLHPSLFLFGG